MIFKTNFNDYVKVKLTEHGKNIMRKYHDELNERITNSGGKGFGPYVCITDDEGYSHFQIWQLMQDLGPHMSIAKPEPFEGEMIFLNGELIRESKEAQID